MASQEDREYADRNAEERCDSDDKSDDPQFDSMLAYQNLVDAKNCCVCTQWENHEGSCSGHKSLTGCPDGFEFTEDTDFKKQLEDRL